MIDNIVERHKEIHMSTCFVQIYRLSVLVDKYSLHLSSMIPKRGSYINAIYVPVFLFFLSCYNYLLVFFLLILSFYHIQLEINKQLIVYNVVLSFQSFIKAKRFIVTHYPTPEDAVDFLRLLNDHESDTVICMDPIRQVESVRNNLLMLSINKNIFISYLLLSCFCCFILPPFTTRFRVGYLICLVRKSSPLSQFIANPIQEMAQDK